MKILNSIRAIAAVVFTVLGNCANAQLVNCNVFLQGKYVEIGVNINGAFGSSENAPAGYHARSLTASMKNTCTGGCSSGGLALGFVADPAKDGWTVGTPNYIGDYFLPGDPQEGWSVEVNGVQTNAWNTAAGCASGTLFTGGLSGTNVGYSSSGEFRSGIWRGNNGSGLAIEQITTLDTGKVFFTMYITLRNTTALSMPGVYYLRTMDPDNEVAVPSGGSFSTTNTIDYQLPNALNATLVSATGPTFHAYLGLGTLDCRAKCFLYPPSLEPGANCDALWAGTATGELMTGTHTGDEAVGLVFNLGTIAAGDSVKFAYAYVLSSADLLAALHSTTSGWTSSIDTASHNSRDTSYVCQNSLDTVTITNPGTYDWSWLSITGEPVSPTTGTTTTVNVGTTTVVLMAVGTGVCITPDTVVMVIKPKGPGTVTASSNSPICIGNILDLTATATASGATFSWTGPSSFTSALQNPSITGATAAASGVYTVTAFYDGCRSAPATTTVVVSSSAGAITGDLNVCVGFTTPLSDTVGGGSWSSLTTGIATVDSVTGVVKGVSSGTTIITYSTGPSCYATAIVTVNPISPITGASSICVGAKDTLHGGGKCYGGTWGSSVTSVATVGSTTGIVTAVGPGVTTITFYMGAIPYSTFTITVNPAPAAITPTGTVTVCVGATTTLGETGTGGSWTSGSSSIATVGSTGIVTGVSNGTAIITYGTSTCYVIKSVTVVGPLPIMPHSPSICIGSTVLLTDATTGGSWVSGNTAVATVAGGTVFGIATGIAPISYIAGGCTVVDTVTVTSGAGTIEPTTAVSLCAHATTVLTNTTGGGIWTSGNTGVATIASDGTVTGVAAGTANITYAVGSCLATKTVTVTAGPAPLTPASASICIGTTATFTETVGGGVWASSGPTVATVAGGVVTGLAVGTATISYSIGTCIVTAPVTVNNSPAAITPLTAVSICIGSTTALGETVTGGIWSSGNTGIATVTAAGVVTGVATGSVAISYALGSCYVVKTVNVVSGPGPITPSPATICLGSPTTLSNATTGGVWSTGNPLVATVGSGGAVYGVALGTATISYSLGSCIVTAPVTVVNPPSAITTTSATTFCSGTSITLSDATAGGVWTSSAPTVATVVGGVVTGRSGGTATITYSVGSCYAIMPVTVTPGPAPISLPSFTICTGNTLTLSDAAPGGVWSSANSAIATVGTGGAVTGIAVGTTTILYTLGGCAATSTVTVGLTANAGTITGPSTECVGSSSIVLTDPAGGGVWTSSNTGVATVSGGTVGGVAAGTATISYSVTTACGTAVALHPVTINTTASGGTIVGPSTICAGTFTVLTDVVAGGVWHSSNATATITSGGLLTGVTPGTDTITYVVTSSCGTASAPPKIITIGAYLTAGFISGPTVVCQGAHITLTDPATGGVWSSFNTSLATVTSGGVVYGAGVGVDTIFYTVSSACGTAKASYAVTVNSSSVAAGTISGPSAVCIGGGSITLTETATGGVWSRTNSHANVTSGGVVTPVSAGVDTIKYTVTGTCGAGVATWVVTVSASPSAGSISGPGFVCAGLSSLFTDASAGGVWSSSNANATVGSASGVVTGVNPGRDTITYTITNACGTASAIKVVTINPTGSAGAITGPDSLCMGASITLTGAVSGGIWSSGSANATVGSLTGIVTGVANGIAPITYTVTTSCGTATSVRTVFITPMPSVGVISGISIVCLGSGITWTVSTPGGTWSASNPHAGIVAPGIIDGVTLGVDTIFYSIAGSCGVATTSKVVSVDPVPFVTPIIGQTTHCLGTLITLTDATPDGVWASSNNPVATIGLTTGVSMGVSLGVATLSYTVTNIYGCPTSVTIQDTVIVGPVVPAITGASAVCFGASITLSDALAGGTWSSSNSFIASVDPSGGVVTGISVGAATISYNVANVCGVETVTKTVTVNPLPSISVITGNPNQCVGSTTTLFDATLGGVWSSGDTMIARVNPITGVVTGVAAGSTIIFYTFTNSLGCSSTVTIVDNVYPAPFVAPITGITHECQGATTTLSDATGGGVWSSNDPAIASVDGSGVVRGISGGVVTISYSVTVGCTAVAIVSDTVNTPPVAAPITGSTHVCIGVTTTLSNVVPLGIWSSGNPAIATVDPATGVVMGVAVGTDKIYYTVSNGCGAPVTDSVTITVYELPPVTAITAPFTTLCQGTTVHLTDATPGGLWSTSDTLIATVNILTGVVTGIAPGHVTIRYTVTNGSGCSNTASIDLIVSGSMPATTLLPSGTATLCRGQSILMHVVTTDTGLAYQWMQNGIVIPGATGSGYRTYTTSQYSVFITNGVCSVTLTDTVVIMAPPNPVIAFTPPDILYTSTFVSYQWYLDWVAIPGATTRLIHEVSNGVYHVVVTDINGCTDTSGQYSAVVVSGVNTIVNPSDIKVYPNPASSVLHIDAPVKVNVSVLSVDGKRLIEQKNASDINIGTLANGMYLIMVYDEQNLLLKTAKFAKIE